MALPSADEGYTLYYLNRNYTINTIKCDTLDTSILIPEDLIFINIRQGVFFKREPHPCIDLTDLERLIMSTEFFDMQIIKDGDFRKANTYLSPLCDIDFIPM